MLLADGRLPAGGHAQSAGLEAALNGGMSVADIPAYLTMRLRTVATVDAGVAVTALAALADSDPDRLVAVQRHWAARTPSHVQRQSSLTLGRGHLRLLRHLFPGHPVTEALAAVDGPCRPLLLAGFGAVTGLGPVQLATLVCYDDVQSVTAAALKLVPLDPAHAVRWALDCRPTVDAVVARVAHLVDPGDIPATAAPLLEQWIHAHARDTRRLFSA